VRELRFCLECFLIIHGKRPKKYQCLTVCCLLNRAWKKGVKINPEVGSKAYIDANGNWMHTTNGVKHWICERMIC